MNRQIAYLSAAETSVFSPSFAIATIIMEAIKRTTPATRAVSPRIFHRETPSRPTDVESKIKNSRDENNIITLLRTNSE